MALPEQNELGKVLELMAKGVADLEPDKDFVGMPRLTIRMTARIQGFPDEWQFSGKKTAAYRQIGNAFPPPVARAVGKQIVAALGIDSRNDSRGLNNGNTCKQWSKSKTSCSFFSEYWQGNVF